MPVKQSTQTETLYLKVDLRKEEEKQ